jgi:invasion protein IalB
MIRLSSAFLRSAPPFAALRRIAGSAVCLSALVGVAVTAAQPALAQQRAPAAAAPASGGQGQALELGTFGDWVAYTSPAGRPKVCYIVSKPKERLPRNLNRDPGFLFVTARPAERVRNEISIVLGFPAKEDVPGSATIGQTSFALAPKGRNAWIANAAEEGTFLEQARRGQSVLIKVTSGRGNEVSDRYSLAGLAQALDRMRRECP